ncbi:serine aminopeptidase domain-containing protein [Puia dinghuensis]|uniref:serine aminopeptidase domain-containing protein n=1 Tax=Puia dinghuensis TaxID=1792502 RepID=UPI0016669C2D|nr:alpha/beta hydrolase [Puia dinghuensis]
MVNDEIVNFGENRSICGIFTPSLGKVLNDKFCVIFLNAGLIHKVGPNQIYKKLAANFSRNGYAAFRLDFSGLGDSGSYNGTMSKSNRQTAEVGMAMNWLQENKDINQFILSGMCSGAKVAWKASLDDRRVIGLCLIDGVFADDQLLKQVGRNADRQLRIRYYKKHLFSWERWIKFFSGKSRLLSLKNILKKKQVNGQMSVDLSNNLTPWENLFKRKVKIQLIFSEGSIAIDIYKLTLSKWLNGENGLLQTILVKDVDHTFTPIWSQKYLSDLTMAWLKKEFEL